MGGYWPMMAGGFWGVLDMLLFLALLGVVIYLALRAALQIHNREPRGPLQIAEERYARGEISADELREIRKNLLNK